MGIRMALLDRDRLPKLFPALLVATHTAQCHAERVAHGYVAGHRGEDFLEALDCLLEFATLDALDARICQRLQRVAGGPTLRCCHWRFRLSGARYARREPKH